MEDNLKFMAIQTSDVVREKNDRLGSTGSSDGLESSGKAVYIHQEYQNYIYPGFHSSESSGWICVNFADKITALATQSRPRDNMIQIL